jgi:hypothetical protein
MSTMLRLRAKTFAFSLTFAAVCAVPSIALADEPKKDCEPGSWFCGDTQPASKDLQPLPGEGKAAESKPAESKPAEKTSPPVVVVQPVEPRDAPPPYYYVPRKAKPRKEWGLNLHLGGAMLGRQSSGNSGMAVGGAGLRFRPIPHLAIESDLDFAGGRDYYGFRRTETALAFNGIVFVNPKNVVQVYFLGGFGWSWANAIDDTRGFDGPEYNYAYFGMQAGAGLEFRISKVVALNVDLRGLIRGRIDDRADRHPEFVSNDGRSTNTSGAGIVQGGLTFYW